VEEQESVQWQLDSVEVDEQGRVHWGMTGPTTVSANSVETMFCDGYFRFPAADETAPDD